MTLSITREYIEFSSTSGYLKTTYGAMYTNLRVSVVEQMNTLRSISLEIFHESDYPEERLKQEIELLINDDLRLQIRQTFNYLNYNIEKKKEEVILKKQ